MTRTARCIRGSSRSSTPRWLGYFGSVSSSTRETMGSRRHQGSTYRQAVSTSSKSVVRNRRPESVYGSTGDPRAVVPPGSGVARGSGP